MSDGEMQKLASQVAELEAQVKELTRENARLQAALETRKLVERAKGVIMQQRRWTEARAYRVLQKTEMQQRTTLAKLSKKILNGEGIRLDGET